MNTFKSLDAFSQLCNWPHLRFRSTYLSKPQCASTTVVNGDTVVEQCRFNVNSAKCKCSSACHSRWRPTRGPGPSARVHHHHCPSSSAYPRHCRHNMCDRRASSQRQSVSARSSLVIVHLLLYLLLVSMSHGKETFDEPTEPRQINLIKELNLHNFSYSGLSPDSTHTFPSAIYFYEDSSRNVRLNSQVCQQAAKLISQGNDVTFLATIRQSTGNTGALFAFTDGIHRVLEVQSSGRRKELRFQYRQQETVFSEVFKVDLADDTWHKIALTVSDVRLDLYIDCVHRFQRQILPIDKETLLRRNLTLWLGQRGRHHFTYQGYLRDVRIVSSANGFRAQCPVLETACPTCGQFKALKDSISSLEGMVKLLTEKLRAMEQRVSNVESCDCVKGCRVNGTMYPDGFTWRQNCDNCTCSAGKVTCKKIKCENSCRNFPQQQQDACCPKCKKQCFRKGKGKLNEGEKFVHNYDERKFKCTQCVCEQDGKLNCRETSTLKCPKLNCTADRRIRPHDECCEICEGTDFCAQGHSCHANAECRNLRTNYTCLCKSGYRGNGHTCVDVDECAEQSHNCSNAVCVNKLGYFECRCKSGFTAVDAHRCIDIDECSTKQHMCGENAICLNRPGDYQCKCKEGYEGDGRVCKPVCKHSCQNGGHCVAPNTCSCRRGYYGHRCEADIDECELGLHQCPANSKCSNKFGWYRCDCNRGYEPKKELLDSSSSAHEFECRDIDECANPLLNTCPRASKCINFDGGYRCECNQTNTGSSNYNESSSVECRTCSISGIERQHGDRWPSDIDSCTTCQCSEGVVTCERKKCDCSDQQRDVHCCQQCNHAKVCIHQEDRNKVFKSGQRWNYDCQTCECMNGEIDCWNECPPADCLNPIRAPGDCCFRCDDDPCQSSTLPHSNATLAGCRHLNKEYRSGELVMMNSDKCTSCLCQNGRLCCSYTSSCWSDSPKVARSSDAFNVSLHQPYSVTGAQQANHFPLGSITNYIDSFFGDDNYDDNLVKHGYDLDDSADSSSSHEFGISDKKLSPVGKKKRFHKEETEGHAEDDRSKDDFLADWSHELATK